MALRDNVVNSQLRWGSPTFLDGVSRATWAYWIKPDWLDWPSGAGFFSNSTSIATDGFTFVRNSSVQQIDLYLNNSGINLSRTPMLPGDVWQHHIWTYNSADVGNEVRFYLDRILQTLAFGPNFPATIGAASSLLQQFKHTSLPAGMVGNLAETYIWSEAITDAGPISHVYRGCAGLVEKANLEFDVGHLRFLPTDRSENALAPTQVGSALTVVAHPPAVVARNTCGAILDRRFMHRKTQRRTIYAR